MKILGKESKFLVGIALGICLGIFGMFLWYQPSGTLYDGETAEYWHQQDTYTNNAYTTAQNNFMDKASMLNNLTNCLDNLRNYFDYYDGIRYDTNDRSDIVNCETQYAPGSNLGSNHFDGQP